ncbi:galactocerebrosidase-like isoform X3 [Asterias amurensis]|uniref:galactocerebrosidase-like isoform X3 n=1 Tax=Asterias amurensis TaxID=7602 RepID=UPI003AB2BB04
MGKTRLQILFLGLLFEFISRHSALPYVVSDVGGLGRRYDGIGGLSGGGATSRLLVNYSEPYRSEILDYLFKPNFGASLTLLKVEIGGDSQSTDGTESSHMHTSDDENYQRGYEWWLMKEAKKRNPNIKLYGLPWAFPGWIGNGTHSPYANIDVTVDYISRWIQGAKTHHNLTIDYIGIWNERKHSIAYIIALRAALDKARLDNVDVVAADGKFRISQDILKNHTLAAAVKIIGVHYPGTTVTNYTLETGKTIWSSEDFSTFNDDIGAGCWARILNQNYVNGMMTCTISWNLVASYYDALPYKRTALMTANEPWSGYYDVTDTIWITAHTTQFSQPGWMYLRHGAGVQHLDKGGSFVSLTDGTNLTIIVETMTHDHSLCVRPYLPPYDVAAQNVTFNLQGSFVKISTLNVWSSKLRFDGQQPSSMFVKNKPIKVVKGSFTFTIGPDEIYTFTTSVMGRKGSYQAPPPSKPFPLPYSDNFDNYPLYSEASNFADQAGVWEIRDSNNSSHKYVMEQVVTDYPVYWCEAARSPVSVIGNYSWRDINVAVDVIIGANGGAFLAHRIKSGGCQVRHSLGLFFMVYSNATFSVYNGIDRQVCLSTGKVNVNPGSWFNMQLLIKDNEASGFVGGKLLFSLKLEKDGIPNKGFVAIGTPEYTWAQFDNFKLV